MSKEGDGGRSTGIVVGLMILLVIGPAAAAHVAARWLSPDAAESPVDLSTQP